MWTTQSVLTWSGSVKDGLAKWMCPPLQHETQAEIWQLATRHFGSARFRLPARVGTANLGIVGERLLYCSLTTRSWNRLVARPLNQPGEPEWACLPACLPARRVGGLDYWHCSQNTWGLNQGFQVYRHRFFFLKKNPFLIIENPEPELRNVDDTVLLLNSAMRLEQLIMPEKTVKIKCLLNIKYSNECSQTEAHAILQMTINAESKQRGLPLTQHLQIPTHEYHRELLTKYL